MTLSTEDSDFIVWTYGAWATREDLFSCIGWDTLAGRPFLWPLLPDSVCQSPGYKMSRNVQTKPGRKLALRGDGRTCSPEGLRVNVLRRTLETKPASRKLPFCGVPALPFTLISTLAFTLPKVLPACGSLRCNNPKSALHIYAKK